MTSHSTSIIKLFLSGMFLAAFFVAPFGVHAAIATYETAYRPQTNAELIAYLQGRIAQLVVIQKMLQNSGSDSAIVTTLPQSITNYVTATTHKATEIGTTAAYLRGEVALYGNAYAYAWFEYGQDEDFLDQKTNKVSIRSAYDRPVRVMVRNLQDDERYYFRLVTEDNNNVVKYGDVYGFRTDEVDN